MKTVYVLGDFKDGPYEQWLYYDPENNEFKTVISVNNDYDRDLLSMDHKGECYCSHRDMKFTRKIPRTVYDKIYQQRIAECFKYNKKAFSEGVIIIPNKTLVNFERGFTAKTDDGPIKVKKGDKGIVINHYYFKDYYSYIGGKIHRMEVKLSSEKIVKKNVSKSMTFEAINEEVVNKKLKEMAIEEANKKLHDHYYYKMFSIID